MAPRNIQKAVAKDAEFQRMLLPILGAKTGVKIDLKKIKTH